MSTGPARLARAWACFATALLLGCATTPPPPSSKHLDPAAPVAGQVPEFAVAPPMLMPPKPAAKPELYSVVVHEIAVQDLLFALARDAKLNVAIHPSITGNVSMNALDQTLTEILDSIAQQVDMRYVMNGKSLSVTPDTPYLKMYRVDYPNILRNSESSISTSVSVSSASVGPGSSGSGTGSNASDTKITNTANNRFWETLVANLRDLLRETDKVIPGSTAEAAPATTAPAGTAAATPAPAAGAATPAATAAGSASAPKTDSAATKVTFREAASIIANPENGVINVRATQRQHEKIREFLDRIMGNARRQVLIEATIVEVDLSDRFQQGIDWSMVRTTPGFTTNVGGTPSGPATGMMTGGLLSGLTALTWSKTNLEYSFTAALRLLESFGTLRVLSSPKISVLNSQTSILKVVDNEVYFTVTVTPGTPASPGVAATPATYSTTVNTVPIGFLMTVTPQINDNGEVILNLRPTISRINGFATDPSPALAGNTVTNRIPIVQTREMESILRVQSGDIAVLGGLMQDTRDRKSDGVPGLSSIPWLGNLFAYQDNKSRKSELVIFLRPTVLTDSSLDGDFQGYRATLRDAQNSFGPSAEKKPAAPRP